MIENMGFEVDFLPVGDGQRSGDAIAVRFGVPGAYKVLVYDGGTKASGQLLVQHIRQHFGTERVDYLINSHPDGDHASGLSVVMEDLEVGELWMHRPWIYSDVIREYFDDQRMTDASLARRLQDKMSAAYRLEEIALNKGIPIMEPFAGEVIGGLFHVLSPGANWYVHDLVPEFAKSPELKKSSASLESAGFFSSLLEKVIQWVDEHWHVETLREDVITSAENESSVVLFARFADAGLLLTGDAGVRALGEAAAFAESLGFDLPTQATMVQVPHHGSRNNVSSSVMDRLFGKPLDVQPENPKRWACVSAATASETHPRLVVVNAFIRRGFGVGQTKGEVKNFSRSMPLRGGWRPAELLKFSSKGEAWD